MPEQEIWKDIKGYEGQYEMSDKRVVRSKGKTIIQQINGKEYKRVFQSKILKQSIDSEGYLSVCLGRENIRVHQLFYNTFIGDSSGYIVDHIDRNKLNNDPSNLRLLTPHLSVLNRTLPYKPDITDMNKYYQKKHNGSMSKPFVLRFGEDNKRMHIGYFATYEEAENKYKDLYVKRQERIDASSKVFTIGS